MSIEAGRLLSERYRLVRPVGQGAQASVWVAEHLALGTQVAVKLIDPALSKKEDALARFRREATAAAQLRSPHVVQILDHGIDEGQPFIVMELLEGEDLYRRLEARRRLPLKHTSKIVTHVARALSRAHAAGIVHRDLKPENVFLVPNEDEEIAKVLDFGVAKVSESAATTKQRTGVGTLLGTPHYMSPEQVKGLTEIDFRSDLWSLGVIAYECVVGQLPFDSEGVGDLLVKIVSDVIPVPSRRAPDVPPAFDAWFLRACSRDPQKRFDSAREMAEALAVVAGFSTDAEPESFPEVAGVRPARRLGNGPKPSEPLPLVSKIRGPLRPPRPAHPASNAPTLAELPASSAADATPPPAEVRSATETPAAKPEMPGVRTPLESAGDSTEVMFDEESAEPFAMRPTAPAGEPARVSLPWPPPQPSSDERMARRSTVSGLASSDLLPSVPPPELDGARRRRKYGAAVVGLLVATVFATWFALRSRSAPSLGVPVPADVSAASELAPPSPELTPPAVTPPPEKTRRTDKHKSRKGPKRTKPASSVVGPTASARPAGSARVDPSGTGDEIVLPDALEDDEPEDQPVVVPPASSAAPAAR